MSATTAGRRIELAQKARAFPVGSFRTIGLAATAIGLVLLLLSLKAHADRVWSAYHFNFVFWLGLAQAQRGRRRLAKAGQGTLVGAGDPPRRGLGRVSSGRRRAVLRLVPGADLHLPVGHARPEPTSAGGSRRPGSMCGTARCSSSCRGFPGGSCGPTWPPTWPSSPPGSPWTPPAEERGLITRDAALVAIAFAFGLSIIAFDTVMSLAHRWVSNLYGAFYFMGSFLCALMWLAVLSIRMRRRMDLGDLYSRRQQHDLGKLCFGFTVFWAYLMFAQFLVIWYGNLPEETYFIFYRLWGPWRPVGVAVFLLVFLIPFIGLLGARPKRSSAWLLGIALLSVAGHLAGALLRNRSLAQRRGGSGDWPPRAWRAAVHGGPVCSVLQLVRRALSDGLAPTRRRHAGAGARPLAAPFADTSAVDPECVRWV